jgi:hypothetical protein
MVNGIPTAIKLSHSIQFIGVQNKFWTPVMLNLMAVTPSLPARLRHKFTVITYNNEYKSVVG